MLFNSYEFLFAFCPLVFFVYFYFGKYHPKLCVPWITLSSLFFYAWWDPSSLALIAVSMVVNYLIGYYLMFAWQKSLDIRKKLLVIGIVFNLIFLGYFKYSQFLFIEIFGISSIPKTFCPVELPLGVSFFTFVQIAFLVDAFRKEEMRYGPNEYAFFVTYFPHLIAGPIIHHKDIIPLLREPGTFRFSERNFSVGLTIFSIGLFKKTVLADAVGDFVPAVFDHPPSTGLTLFEAWAGAISYTLQIYFDFSAYSDMALGLSKAMNIPLPLNFYSPYKSKSIIEFWRRWHISLSRFLRDYLYISLGGNRKGVIRRYLNLFATMILGGLWHGAGWTFIIWGALHGVYLIVNHAWRNQNRIQLPSALSQFITLICVIVAWVFFRAPNVESAVHILQAMSGLGAVSVGPSVLKAAPFLAEVGVMGSGFFPNLPHFRGLGLLWLFGLSLIALLGPSVADIFKRNFAYLHFSASDTKAGDYFLWRPNQVWAFLSAILAVTGIVFLNKESVFLYFQF